MPAHIRAEFIPGAEGNIFVLHASPESSPMAHVIYVPPFCEEMNRCRQLITQHARILARQGYTCTVVDVYGTGDSDGTLENASWDTWLGDIQASISWVTEQHEAPVILSGLRLGGLLAADFTHRFIEQIRSLILFQPVTTGKTYLTQILRQRVANLINTGQPPETTDEIRTQLAAGQTVEVAGYTLGGQLCAAIDATKLGDMENIRDLPILWLENLNEPDAPLPPGSQKAINQLTTLGNRVTTHTLCGPPLWQLHEREPIQGLLDSLAQVEPPL